MLTPFGELYNNNGGHGRESACCVCGREVKDPLRYMVEVVDGGGTYVRHTDDPHKLAHKRFDQASYMGFFPVGPGCRHVLERDGVVVTNMKGVT